jgi:decaprenyl-phosphate phosphoribosyltransferase
MALATHRPPAPTATALVREARPKQWLKNLLVFLAPGAAGVLGEWPSLWRTVVVFLSMSAAASGTYFLNDVVDVDADRRHPSKCRRPVAAGGISLSRARAMSAMLMTAALVLAALTGRWETVTVVAAYLAVTVGYSVALKRIAIVDLLTVAAGFVLRAVAGAVAVAVPLSAWSLLCVSFGSLFIVAGKRYAELLEFGDNAIVMRASLDAYTVAFLRRVLAIAAAGTAVTYCLWVFAKTGAAAHEPPLYQLSAVPVAVALLRYRTMVETGSGGAPEDVVLADRPLAVLGAIWIALVVLSATVA